jgi:hypothetical protein
MSRAPRKGAAATQPRRRDTGAPTAVGEDAGRVLYLYGVSASASAAPRGVAAIDGEANVEAIRCGDLVCWLSRVSRRDFAERLEDNMQNLEWLAGAGVRHQRVVSALATQGDILPTRFGSVFLSEQSLCADIEQRRAELRAALERIASSDEWGVKVFVEAKPAAAAAAAAASGRDYLVKKSASLQQRGRPQPPPDLDEFADALRQVAKELITMKKAAGQPMLVWHAALLVPRRDAEKFHAVVQRFAKRLRSARIETSGPWPAYSFAG